MHILHIYKDYIPVVGGIENHIKLLAEGQAAAGHTVTVLVTNTNCHSTKHNINGVQVFKAGRFVKTASTPVSLRLLADIASRRADITHLHFPYPVGEVGNYLFGKSARTVITYHSDIVRQVRLLRLYRPLMLRILERANRIIVASQPYLDSSPFLQQFKNKCTVIPYSINQEPFINADSVKAQELRHRYNSRPLLLFVGVLRYYKGLQYLLQAMTQVDARLVVVGAGPQGEALRRLAGDLGVASKVEFVGQVPDADLPAYYRAADCFVLPSSERSEAFGLVLLEALASGLPIVSTELGTGTSYVNKNDESGLVVSPKDAWALTRAINQILNNHDLRSRLALGARARASLFQVDRMLCQTMALYEQALASP